MKQVVFLFAFFLCSILAVAQETVRVPRFDWNVRKGTHSIWASGNLYAVRTNYVPRSGWDVSSMFLLGTGVRYEYAYRDNHSVGFEFKVGISGVLAMDIEGSHDSSSYWQASLLHTFQVNRFKISIGPSLEWSDWRYTFDGDLNEYGVGSYGLYNFSIIRYAVGPSLHVGLNITPAVSFNMEYSTHWMWKGELRGKWDHYFCMKIQVRCAVFGGNH